MLTKYLKILMNLMVTGTEKAAKFVRGVQVAKKTRAVKKTVLKAAKGTKKAVVKKPVTKKKR